MSQLKSSYQSAFSSGRQVVHVGSLQVASGKIVACDPFFAGVAGPFTRTIAAGNYDVQLAVKNLPDWGGRNTMARLVIDPSGRAHAFENADVELADSNRYSVESGLGCFMDELTRQRFAEVMARFYQATPAGNYYDDVLAAEFKKNADPANEFDFGSWDLHVLPGSSLNIAMFASGLGDNTYESFWVLDERNEAIALVTDFRLE